MLLMLGFGVLLITYVPWLTTGLLQWIGTIVLMGSIASTRPQLLSDDPDPPPPSSALET